MSFNPNTEIPSQVLPFLGGQPNLEIASTVLGISKKNLQAFQGFFSRSGQKRCWKWRGWKTPAGYGGYKDSSGKIHLAHRVAYQLWKGEKIPEGGMVCHACDVRDCVNPHHLFVGTAKDNAQDMAKKGRARGGRKPATSRQRVKRALAVLRGIRS